MCVCGCACLRSYRTLCWARYVVLVLHFLDDGILGMSLKSVGPRFLIGHPHLTGEASPREWGASGELRVPELETLHFGPTLVSSGRSPPGDGQRDF